MTHFESIIGSRIYENIQLSISNFIFFVMYQSPKKKKAKLSGFFGKCSLSYVFSSFYEFSLKSAKNFITEANPLKAHSIAVMLAPQNLPTIEYLG